MSAFAAPLEATASGNGQAEAGAATKESAGDHREVQALRDGFHGVHEAREGGHVAAKADEGDEGDEDMDGQYQLVKKSIYKAPKQASILRRLAGIAGGGAKHKYAIPPRALDAASAADSSASSPTGKDTLEPVDLYESTDGDDAAAAVAMEEYEVEPIGVSIDRSIDDERLEDQLQEARAVPPTTASSSLHHNRDDAVEDAERTADADAAALQQPPQVVIHSGESDSETGFATLNPVIAARRKLAGPARSAAVASADASPFLVQIPSPSLSVEPTQGGPSAAPSFLLVVNALGASGLLKVEKFGTQSTLLELQLCSRGRAPDQGSRPPVMRTCVHKKGGSEAQWNQQFTSALTSKHEQFLRASVKTNNRIVVGQADVPLDKVGDLFYDQHYPLFRLEGDERTEETNLIPGDARRMEARGECPAGYLHLQLKIMDASAGLASPTSVPRLHLPFPTASEPPITSFALQDGSGTARIPSVLASGSLLFKVPFRKSSVVGYSATPRRVWVAVVANDRGERFITWSDPTASSSSGGKKGGSFLNLADVTQVVDGHATKAFEGHKASSTVKEKGKCFSLVATSRTLDLVAASKEEATVWVAGLRGLLFPSQAEASTSASLSSARTIYDYRQVALSSARASAEGQAVLTTDPVKKKQQLAAWRSQVFDLARRSHIDAVASSLRDGCPIDLLETGSGDTLLIIACREGNAPLVELCLSWRAKNDPHPEFGDTALQVAVAHRHVDCLELLLLTAAKSDMDAEIVNHIDSSSDAPLHVAARNGDFPCLQRLLLHGADMCVVDEIGRTPLHCAVATAERAGADCVAYLLDVGGDSVLNLGDHEGDTPLHYAALAGNDGAVKLLLESAADALATNLNGETPLDVAVRERHERCADLIAAYSSRASAGDPSVPLGGECVLVDDEEERQRELSQDECEEDTGARHQRHPRRRRHHRRSVRVWNEEEDDDDERAHGSSSASDREGAYDSSRSSSSCYGPDLANQSMDCQQRPWRAMDQAHDANLDGRGRNRVLEASRGWPDPVQHDASTLSASEQVRAALARHQRSLSVVASGRPPMSARSAFGGVPKRKMSLSEPSSHYFSARSREWSSPRSEQQPLYWVDGRQLVTERLDRHWDVDLGTQRPRHTPPVHIVRGGHNPEHAFRASENGRDAPRSRSRSEGTSSSSWSHRSGSQAWSDRYYEPVEADPRQRHTTASCAPPTTWTSEQGAFTTPRHDQWPRRPATAGSASSAPAWDLLYTEDGYPYYVNRYSGVSQWEKPLDAEIVPPLAQTIGSAPTSARGPDEIIRMRLAQARRQQSMPAVVRTQQTTCSSSEAPREGEGPGPTTLSHTTSAAVEVRTNDVASSVGDGVRGVPPAIEASLPEPQQSTYESRTGLKLSIDIAAPPSKEHARPAFVPSPRSKRDAAPCDSGQAAADGTSEQSTRPADGSFQKSRASSPRGRSKNVSLIELKRANNLAVALASFKIHDRYERIIDGIIAMDEAAVSASLLACLQRFFPTEQEREALRRFGGDVSSLGKPERFFYLLFQVPSVQTRIDMFLYKLEFARMQHALFGRILVVKRACRDLAENFAFVQTIERFFASQAQPPSLALLRQSRDEIKRQFLAEADEKLTSFRGDLEKAASIDVTDLQLQLNRLLAGRRSIQAFLGQESSAAAATSVSSTSSDDAESATSNSARDILERFLRETRKPVADVENEFESMDQWSDKLLAVVGESKASCRLADLIECILRLL